MPEGSLWQGLGGLGARDGSYPALYCLSRKSLGAWARLPALWPRGQESQETKERFWVLASYRETNRARALMETPASHPLHKSKGGGSDL